MSFRFCLFYKREQLPQESRSWSLRSDGIRIETRKLISNYQLKSSDNFLFPIAEGLEVAAVIFSTTNNYGLFISDRYSMLMFIFTRSAYFASK